MDWAEKEGQREGERCDWGDCWEIARENKRDLCFDIVFKSRWSGFFIFIFHLDGNFVIFTLSQYKWSCDLEITMYIAVLMYFWQFYHISDRHYFFLPWDIGSGETGFSEALLRLRATSMCEALWGRGEASKKPAPDLGDPRVRPELLWRGKQGASGGRGGLSGRGAVSIISLSAEIQSQSSQEERKSMSWVRGGHGRSRVETWEEQVDGGQWRQGALAPSAKLYVKAGTSAVCIGCPKYTGPGFLGFLWNEHTWGLEQGGKWSGGVLRQKSPLEMPTKKWTAGVPHLWHFPWSPCTSPIGHFLLWILTETHKYFCNKLW